MVKRCPNGTRRNKKTGKCERKKRRLRSNSKRVRRCQNGFRRIPPKTGSCQKKRISEKKEKLIEKHEMKSKAEKIKKSKKYLDLQERIQELYSLSRPGKPDPLLDAEKEKVSRELAKMFDPKNMRSKNRRVRKRR
mgnify:FL=1